MSLQGQASQAADENFDAAFAAFAKDETPPEAAPAEGGQADGSTDSGATAVDAGTGAGDGAPSGDPAGSTEGGAAPEAGAESGAAAPAGAEPAPVAEAPAAAEPPAASPAAEAAPGPSPDDILNRLAEIVREKPAEQAPAAAADELPPLFTQDEEQFLTTYEKDWSEVSKAEELKRRQFGRDIVQYVFDQVAPKLRELEELAGTVANRQHFSDLEQKIGPIDDNLRTQVESWIGKQPGYLQKTFTGVLTGGTVEEVADLVDRFKKETGVVTAPAPAPSKGGSELSESAKQAAEALAPVSTRRSGVEQQDDPNDFGAAFAKFSEMFKD